MKLCYTGTVIKKKQIVWYITFTNFTILYLKILTKLYKCRTWNKSPPLVFPHHNHFYKLSILDVRLVLLYQSYKPTHVQLHFFNWICLSSTFLPFCIIVFKFLKFEIQILLHSFKNIFLVSSFCHGSLYLLLNHSQLHNGIEKRQPLIFSISISKSVTWIYLTNYSLFVNH